MYKGPKKKKEKKNKKWKLSCRPTAYPKSTTKSLD